MNDGFLRPETRFHVRVTGTRISVRYPAGGTVTIELADLRAVYTETNDSGPFGMDVWWVLIGANNEELLSWPLGATNEAAALDFLKQLPGFEVCGMNSTEEKRHLCWKRSDA